ncbi:MAG TPA: hypothetical protein PKC74_08255, partial [Turneriella sp.]|nr:hypothetical protein [Turneriella sp.]
MKKIYHAIILSTVSAVLFCSGKVTYDLNETGVIAISGELRVPTRVFQAFFDAMKRSALPERKDPRAALFMLIADEYLAAEYKKNKGGKIDALIAGEMQKVYLET